MRRLYLILNIIFLSGIGIFGIELCAKEEVRRKNPLEAYWKNSSICKNCQVKTLVDLAANLKTVVVTSGEVELAQKLPPKATLDCGEPGHPVVKKIPGSNIRVLWQYKWKQVGKTQMAWECTPSVVMSCDHPLRHLAELADASVKLGRQQCLHLLNAYYSKCSPYRNLNFKDRFLTLNALARTQVAKLKIEDRSFNLSITPELLVCTANRETSNLEPFELNVKACDRRDFNRFGNNGFVSTSKNKGMMRGWPSTAYGLVNMLYSTFGEEWQKKRSNIPKEKAFEAMIANPEIQMEMMARYLNSIVKMRKLAGQRDIAFHMVNYYSGQDPNTYANPVNQCAACLKTSTNPISCLPFPPANIQ